MSTQGKDLRVGQTIAVWWRPKRDTITSITPYRGTFENIPGWGGATIVRFGICQSGMTVFADEVYEVFA